MTMNDATRLISYLETVKTERYKHLSLCNDFHFATQHCGYYGTFESYGIRLVDSHTLEVWEYYKCNHHTMKELHENLRTNWCVDYEATHRESEF